MRASNFPMTLLVAAAVGLGSVRTAASQETAERIAADTPKTTVAGNTFVAPAGWSLLVRGPATILEAPEGGSFIALVDVAAKDAKDADAARRRRVGGLQARREVAAQGRRRPSPTRTAGPIASPTPTRRRRTRSATSVPTCAGPTTRGRSRSTTWRRRSARSAARRSA